MFRSEHKRALLLRKIGVAPYLAEYDAADAGNAAHLAIYWENSSGQRGPCRAVTSWTIPR